MSDATLKFSPDCPPLAQLERYAAGDPATAALSPHLEQCASCRRAAARLRENNDLLAAFAPRAADDDSQIAPLGLTPDAIPGYQLVGEIHRGGQGVVYQAVQQSTRRRVALKVMREGAFASEEDRVRFEREVRILSQLKHPNIVAIYDSGQVAGRAYYVMDYIPGKRLDEHMDAGRVPPADALRLFAQICEAVNVAHLRGVIHRDLKPGNIRVDPSGQPHILDFGLAKVSEFDALYDSRTPAMTVTGQFVGSLPWASPEQAEGLHNEIDTRTDVYSLGVIFYQMLTGGEFPYEVAGRMRDVLDRILKAEPIRPSSRRQSIDNEIETIALKCLQKERERRYQTAGELARDVRRYLAGEPIEAKRDSVAYMLRKQLQRHKLPVAIAAGFMAVITTGLFVSLAFWRQAVTGRTAAQEQRKRAEEKETVAVREAAKAKAVNQFLQNMLTSVDPDNAKDGNITVRETLDDAARHIESGALRDQPEIEAAVRTSLGLTYKALGLYDAAEPHLTAARDLNVRAYGENGPQVAQSLTYLASLARAQGHDAENEQLCRAALAIFRSVYGDEHLETAAALNSLAIALQDQSAYGPAETLLREALRITRELEGAESITVASYLNNLAQLLSDKGEYSAAESLYREALALRRNLLGDDHPDVATSLDGLAGLLHRQEKWEEAEQLYRDALRICLQRFGPEHPTVANCLNNLATFLNDKNEPEEAERLQREVVRLRRKRLGNDHVDVANALGNLATTLMDLKNADEQAEPLFREALDIYRKLPHESPHRATHLINLSALLRRREDFQGAEALVREALEVQRQTLPATHPDYEVNVGVLGLLLLDQKKFADAEPFLLESYAALSGNPQASDRQKRQALLRPLVFYEAWDKAEPGTGKAEKADEWRAKLEKSQAATRPAAAP